MDKNTRMTILYDIYGDLLTDKQKMCFEDYYFNNLSLGEISEKRSVSRNAIHKQIKSVESKLVEYELKLKLYEKSNKLEEIISTVTDNVLKVKLEELNK